ncbi:MFS transporter [Metabacillus malikii]|uniref:MFS family permease n=1 Tax=Metabacillus malikii TaxID=1504265 RepID=A0ABT9ZIZ4_9BACI|nr:MFS transporter [Metabacillus malikii]MDQ0232239.1 MFS family permease [Metabacillus malikii]
MNYRFIVIFFWIASVCVASNIYLFIPIYDAISKGISLSYNEVVFSSTLFTSCYACGLLSFGPLSEKFSPKWILIIGMITSSLFTFMISLSFSLSSFYMFRALQGLLLGSFAPVAYSLCFQLFDPKRRTFLIAIINMGFLMAGIIGQLISSYFVSYYDWKAIFYFFTILYTLIALISFFLLPGNAANQYFREEIETTIRKPLLQRPVILGLCLTFFTLMSFVSFYDSLSRHFTGHEQALFLARCIGLIGTPLSLFSGQWLKRYPSRQMIIICLVIMSVSYISMFIFSTFNMITFLSIIFVASLSVLIPSLITFIGEAAAHKRATAISFYSFTLLVGASIGPLLANYLQFQTILIVFILLFLFFIWLFSMHK